MKFASLFALFLLIACSNQSKVQSIEKQLVCFDQQRYDSVLTSRLLNLSISQEDLRCFDTLTFPYDSATKQFQVKGLEMIVDRQGLDRWYSEFQYDLVTMSYQSYISGMATLKGTKVRVLKTGDLYAALKLELTNGNNYGHSTEKVIKRLEEWRTGHVRFLVIGAGHDWVTLRIIQPPFDWPDFAKAVYAFCPDVVDHDPNLLQAFANQMKIDRQFTMWWD